MPSFLNNHNVRGIRNNNPFNLIRTNIAWQGKIPFAQNPDTKFEQFTSVEYGLRAGFKDLINDISKGKNTVRKLISEFAPPHENNTDAYIASVAKSLGVTADQKLTEINGGFLLTLARAILRVELGAAHTAITDSHIRAGLKLVGDASTSNLKVNAANGFKLLEKVKPFIIPAIITVGLFFYTYASLIVI